MKAYLYNDDEGKDISVEEIPEDLRGRAEEYRQAIIDAVSEYDDGILEKYLEGEEIEIGEIKAALRKSDAGGRTDSGCLRHLL